MSKKTCTRSDRSLGDKKSITLKATFFIFASLFLGGRRGVWFRVLCDVLRKHNRDRAADSLSDKGMIC